MLIQKIFYRETSSALWRKFESYDPKQAFIYWALRFAYFEIMKFRDRQKKANRLCKTTLKLYPKNVKISCLQIMIKSTF